MVLIRKKNTNQPISVNYQNVTEPTFEKKKALFLLSIVYALPCFFMIYHTAPRRFFFRILMRFCFITYGFISLRCIKLFIFAKGKLIVLLIVFYGEAFLIFKIYVVFNFTLICPFIVNKFRVNDRIVVQDREKVHMDGFWYFHK